MEIHHHLSQFCLWGDAFSIWILRPKARQASMAASSSSSGSRSALMKHSILAVQVDNYGLNGLSSKVTSVTSVTSCLMSPPRN